MFRPSFSQSPSQTNPRGEALWPLDSSGLDLNYQEPKGIHTMPGPSPQIMHQVAHAHGRVGKPQPLDERLRFSPWGPALTLHEGEDAFRPIRPNLPNPNEILKTRRGYRRTEVRHLAVPNGVAARRIILLQDREG